MFDRIGCSTLSPPGAATRHLTSSTIASIASGDGRGVIGDEGIRCGAPLSQMKEGRGATLGNDWRSYNALENSIEAWSGHL